MPAHSRTLILLSALAAAATAAVPADLVTQLQAAKPGIAQRQQDLLAARYDLADRPVAGVTMSGGKPVQGGVRVKLTAGTTWRELAALTPAQIKAQRRWPAGFLPLPHPHHEAGGMVFPQALIDE